MTSVLNTYWKTQSQHLEVFDLDWIESKLKEWKGIQEMVNESQQCEDDRILHRTWSMDIPYLWLYHTLIEDSIRLSLGEAFATKQENNLMDKIAIYLNPSMRRLLISLMMQIGL